MHDGFGWRQQYYMAPYSVDKEKWSFLMKSRCCLVRRMLLKEFEMELELEKESVRNLNPIPYAVWLAGNGIGINSRFRLVRRKWN
uniref:Uncharacterized protein n=1 Tax=Lactuca sativa TaxID=4236 RepID=A0A9R1V105_LACSA|nr:hypothetical protein LSAT_V11C700370770 [Lactuca sativa]